MGDFGYCRIKVRNQDLEKVIDIFEEPEDVQAHTNYKHLHFFEVRDSGSAYAEELHAAGVPFILYGSGVSGCYGAFIIASDGERMAEFFAVGYSEDIPALPCPKDEIPSEDTVREFATRLAHLRYVSRLISGCYSRGLK